MSYYSDVAFVLYREDYDDLVRIGLGMKMVDGPFFLVNLDKAIEFAVGNRRYIFCQHFNVKYYEEREDVKLFKDFLNNHPHSFIRLGSTIDDVESDFEYGSDYVFERLNLKQEIEFN